MATPKHTSPFDPHVVSARLDDLTDLLAAVQATARRIGECGAGSAQDQAERARDVVTLEALASHGRDLIDQISLSIAASEA